MRVERLETWAGPGQAEALSVNIRAIRADVVAMRRVQNQQGVLLDGLSMDVARLKDDVSALRTDVAELKVAVGEILRRLPEPPA